MRTYRAVLVVLIALAATVAAVLPAFAAQAESPTTVHVAGQVTGFLPAPAGLGIRASRGRPVDGQGS